MVLPASGEGGKRLLVQRNRLMAAGAAKEYG